MLDLRTGVLHLDVRHGMRAALVAQQQAVALGEVTDILGGRGHADQPAIGVVRMPGRNPLRHDGRAGVLAEMDHLGAGIGLLAVVRHRDRVELAHRAVARQHAARIFPRHRRAGFDLRPRHLAVLALAQRALGDEVVDAADAVLIARIPVLDGRVLDLGIVQRDQLDDRRVQLVLIAHRRGAAFEVGDVRPLVRDDQRALELAGIFRVDAEIGRQLHRAANALGNVDEGAVREDRRVERREIIIPLRHDLAQPFADQIGIFLDRLGDRTEDHARRFQLLAEGRRDRDAVEHRVNRDLARPFDARQHFLLGDRNAQLFIGPADFGIEFVERRDRLLLLGLRVVIRVLIVDRRDVQLGPVRALQRLPQAKRLQPPVEHPFRLALLGRDITNRILAQPLGREVLLDLGGEAPLVLLVGGGERLCILRGHQANTPGRGDASITCDSTGSAASVASVTPEKAARTA